MDGLRGRATAGFEDGGRGRVDFEPSAYLKPKERKRVDRIGLFCVITGRLALEDAGLEITDDNRERVGVDRRHRHRADAELEEFSLPIIEEGADGGEPGGVPEHGLQRRRRADRDQARRARRGLDGHRRHAAGALGARATPSTCAPATRPTR